MIDWQWLIGSDWLTVIDWQLLIDVILSSHICNVLSSDTDEKGTNDTNGTYIDDKNKTDTYDT